MRGMVLKEFYLMKSLGKSYVFIVGVAILMTFTKVYNHSFVSGLVVMLLLMIPMSTFSYDEAAKWDKFAVATPAGRKGVVQGKYLFALLLGVGVLVLCSLVQVLLFFLGAGGGDPLGERLLAGVACLGVGLALDAILFPCIFKVGVQKGRMLLVLVTVVSTGLFAFGVAALGKGSGHELLETALLGLPVIGVVLLAISYFVSLKLYSSREL